LFTACLDLVELMECWSEEDPEVEFEASLVVWRANGSTSSQVFCVNIEPGKRSGMHTHSVEEIFLVLEGTAEMKMGAERELISEGGLAIIPAQVPHEPLNVGSETLRFLAIFPSAAVLHTWEVPVMPIGVRKFLTPLLI
jgi:quercetin dioxygenase-like cupin family protein